MTDEPVIHRLRPSSYTARPGTLFAPGALRRLADKPTLRTVTLADCPITDDHVADLAGLTDVHDLNFSRTAVTDAALETVSRLRELRYLHLTDTAVTAAGLARLAGHPMLWHLHLEGTPIGDEAVPSLLAVPNLLGVWLSRTAFTPIGLQALTSHPSLAIMPNPLEAESAREVLQTFLARTAAWEGRLRAEQPPGGPKYPLRMTADELADPFQRAAAWRWRAPLAAILADSCTTDHAVGLAPDEVRTDGPPVPAHIGLAAVVQSPTGDICFTIREPGGGRFRYTLSRTPDGWRVRRRDRVEEASGPDD